MINTKEDVFEFVNVNDIKFIRLAFCDVFGNTKNISILSSQLEHAIEFGVSIDASAIKGFGNEDKSDLFLKPDLDTLSLLPWRPSQGRVARFYCDIIDSDGNPFILDSRRILRDAVKKLKEKKLKIKIGAECEFYLFKMDEYDNPTTTPLDNGGYLAMAPEDKGENVRREICLTLENMNIIPQTSHHEEGPGQNEIVFRESDPLSAADNLVSVKTVVKTIASNYGLYASFEPKPISDKPGNGLHINIIMDNNELREQFMAGIINRIKDMTLFLNPTEKSYNRLGEYKAPKYITWSYENRSQLIRVPKALDNNERFELRSPDPQANLYLAYALLIYAGIEGIDNKMDLCDPLNINLLECNKEELKKIDVLPSNLDCAFKIAQESEFIAKYIPKRLLDVYIDGK